MSKEIAVFDYSSLDKDVAAKLQNHAIHLRKAIERFGEAGQKIGEIIWNVHVELAGSGRDGRFKEWVESEGLSRQHAYDLMNVWERSKKCQIIGHLPPTVAYLISAPEVPDSAIKELEKQVGKGVKPTVAGVKEIIERHKDSISEKGSPGGGSLPSSTVPPASAAPEPGEAADSKVAAGREARNSEGTPGTPEGGSNPPATTSGEEDRTSSRNWELQETDPRPPRSGKDKTGYVGKCPNCASSKWTAEGNCAKCNQPFGEPVGDRTEEDPAGTKRSKAVKTCEALMREFDDLNLLVPKAGAHKQVIALCKDLLKSAKSWK